MIGVVTTLAACSTTRWMSQSVRSSGHSLQRWTGISSSTRLDDPSSRRRTKGGKTPGGKYDTRRPAIVWHEGAQIDCLPDIRSKGCLAGRNAGIGMRNDDDIIAGFTRGSFDRGGVVFERAEGRAVRTTAWKRGPGKRNATPLQLGSQEIPLPRSHPGAVNKHKGRLPVHLTLLIL